ncbi:DUF2268 domain-containing protein [Pontibacillus yanchengensis]|uniref:DUF2268 domain-containing protein n=1 Tax=Pontibacillus yanchengensis Y32 TaxID=1385514 RepID=A0A0A2T8N4_9BACI|nr:DUF2268 domain-containing putative Zn-dependent protease [Pontibacillus yanchengensis]KGP71859.1 hypothetical protein N782_16005 [Pontibacillus yanchengensis Y32]
MSVIETFGWLNEFNKACRGNTFHLENLFRIQCETLCYPIEQYESDVQGEELQFLLLQYGLFEPDEYEYMEQALTNLKRMHIWSVIEKEYHRLKRLWNGPDVNVFIFPIKQAHLPECKRIAPKNGVTYKNAIFLFLSPFLVLNEVRALFAHEYHHICRLSNYDKKVNVEQPALKDVIILEGLAENAVKQLYGEKWLGPWYNRYTFETIKELWIHYYIPNLDITSERAQSIFLYGEEGTLFPAWIGYAVGYEIVNSYHTKQQCNYKNLLTLSTEELIRGSILG